MRQMRILAVTILAVGLLAACSRSAPSPVPRMPWPAVRPTAWQAVLDEIQPDGLVSIATALQAFVVADGPIPGVRPPAGAIQTIPSGTLAIDWISAHWSSLTLVQRRAVVADLHLPASAAGTTIVGDAPVSSAEAKPSPVPVADPEFPCSGDSPGAAKFRAWVPGILNAISTRLGRTLTFKGSFDLFLVLAPKQVGTALMETAACVDNGAYVGCQIFINPLTMALTAGQQQTTLIHEIMHCFLDANLGPAKKNMPPWYIEGVPTWVASQLGPTTMPLLTDDWDDYLDTQARPLGGRSYDAVGFFAHLAETGTDVWHRIDPIGDAMLGNFDTAKGWTAAGVGSGFLTSWGSSFVEGRYPGKPWTTGGPNLPEYRNLIPTVLLGDGDATTLTAPGYAAGTDILTVYAQVVIVAPSAAARGRLTIGGGADAPLSGVSVYCAEAKCSCPAGSGGAGTTFAHMSTGMAYLGVAGGSVDASVTLTGLSLTAYCQQSTSCPLPGGASLRVAAYCQPSPSCLVGDWTSTGFDLHTDTMTETGGAGVVMTIDGKGDLTMNFDHMASIDIGPVNGADIAGTTVYSGAIRGVIKLPGAATSSGTWAYASSGSAAGFDVTIDLTRPVPLHIGPTSVAHLVGAESTDVSSQPIVTGGWHCSGDTLTTTPPAGSRVAGAWTLHRT